MKKSQNVGTKNTFSQLIYLQKALNFSFLLYGGDARVDAKN